MSPDRGKATPRDNEVIEIDITKYRLIRGVKAIEKTIMERLANQSRDHQPYSRMSVVCRWVSVMRWLVLCWQVQMIDSLCTVEKRKGGLEGKSKGIVIFGLFKIQKYLF